MNTYRKLIALLMAAIMLLGMVPAAQAQNISCSDLGLSHSWGSVNGDVCYGGMQYCTVCGEGREVSGSHSWYTRVTEQPTCTEDGWSEIICSVCDSEKGNPQRIPALGHNWGSWKEEVAATCTTGGRSVHNCTRCGATETQTTSPLGHDWTDWYEKVAPTCTETGVTQMDCRRCGTYSANNLPATGHAFGEWYVVTEPQVGLPGLEQHDCTNGCGAYEQREIPALEQEFVPVHPTISKTVVNAPANGEYFVAGETIVYRITLTNDTGMALKGVALYDPLSGPDALAIASKMAAGEYLSGEFSYVVTEGDVLAGKVVNVANANYVYADDPAVMLYGSSSNRVETPAGGTTIVGAPTVSLSLSSTPANGTHFVVGEEVTFTESWVNTTDQTLYPLSVSIFTCGTPVFGSTIDQICSWFAEDSGGPVAPGASGGHTLTVTVTEADVARGAIYAMAELLSTVHNGPDLANVATPFVSAPCRPDTAADFGLSASLSVSKQVTSTPANGSYYVPGENVTFLITVSNQGAAQLLNVNVIDPLGGGLVAVLDTLNAGETRDITVVYTTTDIVALAGSVDNGACVKAVDKDGQQYVEYSNIVTVPCGFPASDAPIGIFNSLSVVKQEESMPLNGEYYTEGEVIHYSITYTNDGELPLADVQVWDILSTGSTIGYAETLQPGESRTCYYQHTVTAGDVIFGSVMNMAIASYPIPGSEGYADVSSNVVCSKTNEKGHMDFYWAELLTPDEDHPYDPGTGWFWCYIEAVGTPLFGTIDTDALHSTESYCVRAITGRDNVSAAYETSFCVEHADTQSSALIMAQAAATPELQMQSAAYAIALWRTEVEALYQEIFEAADPTAKTVVMTEYIRFLTEVANYETMLKLIYPDQPAVAALKIAEIWENKCVDLCYDAHAAAAERKDNLLAAAPAVGASAETCTCEVAAQEAGKKTDVQSYCPAHSFPFSMIDALLQGNDTAEAWTKVRQIWGVELTSAYNKVYEAMGDNKLLATAEYNALTQWMMAREASLMALYPDNPEIVVQIMVKTIMERVNALCQLFN